ncbi:hypothetical protein CRG98_032173 [Punica granatum]|uniref:GAG-pre-integrase domain-containing protein n=1 Tax=Punica granatum TaxID=22663 RepID=A0A2I0ITU1_PUNGR|nr:hypothetical protein CRG98_032173 [Punica granatum]
MLFLVTVLNVAYVLDPKLQPLEDPALDATPEEIAKVAKLKKKREEDKFTCLGHILNTLSDRLYDLYMSMQSPMEIWKALEEKYNTERQGHYIKDCKLLKKEKDATTSKANMVEDMDLVAMVMGGIESLEIVMITELNIAMTDKSYNWWLDSRATDHVCNDRQQFKSYEPMANREVLMGNHQSVKVLGQGTVELNFTSGKKLTLINVLHVPDVIKNLLSASLLCSKGFKVILESDKLVLLKGDMYLRKGYCSKGMFKLSIDMNKANSSAYIVESYPLWHARLAHFNIKTLQYMQKNGYINLSDDKLVDKWEICVQ